LSASERPRVPALVTFVSIWARKYWKYCWSLIMALVTLPWAPEGA
jgi:hypothetical protein